MPLAFLLAPESVVIVSFADVPFRTSQMLDTSNAAQYSLETTSTRRSRSNIFDGTLVLYLFGLFM